MLMIEDVQSAVNAMEQYGRADELTPERLAALVLLLENRLQDLQTCIVAADAPPLNVRILRLCATNQYLVGRLPALQQAGALSAERFEAIVASLRESIWTIYEWSLTARPGAAQGPGPLRVHFPPQAPAFILGVFDGGRGP
jgi:hypothetical protein